MQAGIDTATSDIPALIFFSEPGHRRLAATLELPGVIAALQASHAGVALAITSLDEPTLALVRRLADAGISLIAWLCIPGDEGFGLNLTNYPHAMVRYQELVGWAHTNRVQFEAIGLAIEPPSDIVDWHPWRAVRNLARGLWLARDNALFPAAQQSFHELLATIRHDGYAIHTYQLPLIADDRRAGTTLLQRAFDIIDLPSDLDVLICASDVPIDWLGDDIGGALVEQYGPSADAIAVGVIDLTEPREQTLAWPALRRDLLLAAQHTDTIYIASLEQCAESGFLSAITTLNWQSRMRPRPGRTMLVALVRTLLLGLLLLGRYGRTILALAGWVVALIVWLRRGRTEHRTG